MKIIYSKGSSSWMKKAQNQPNRRPKLTGPYMRVENSRQYKRRELQKQPSFIRRCMSRCSSFSHREKEREREWRIRERFCATYLPWRTCSTRYIPSFLVLLIARAPFATSLATIDLFCPVLIDLLVCVRWTMKLRPTFRSRVRLNRRSSNAPRSRPLWLSESPN